MKMIKFPLEIGKNTIEHTLPIKLKTIGFQGDYEKLQGWFLEGDRCGHNKQEVYIALTGEPVDSWLEYVGTAKTYQGTFVVHAFD